MRTEQTLSPRAAAGGVALLVVAVPLITWAVVGGRPTPLLLAVMILPTLAGLVAGLVAYRVLRRRAPATAPGDAATRRAVDRALRTGQAPDARIDALTRDAARASLGTLRAQQGIFGVMLAIWVVLLALRIVRGDLRDTLLAALTTAAFAVTVVVATHRRRRGERYLREGGPVTPRDGAA